MRAVANASVDGAEADSGLGHPTRWWVSLSEGVKLTWVTTRHG